MRWLPASSPAHVGQESAASCWRIHSSYPTRRRPGTSPGAAPSAGATPAGCPICRCREYSCRRQPSADMTDARHDDSPRRDPRCRRGGRRRRRRCRTARSSRRCAGCCSRCSWRCCRAPSSPTRCRAIVTDLDGSQTGYTWVVVATLLTMTATTPIWGKLADLFSKKLLVQTALVIFSVGSRDRVLAPNMDVLIGARGRPGPRRRRPHRAGPGRDRDDGQPRERGRYSGYIGAVFALATVSGPLVGGLIVDSPARLARLLLRRPAGRRARVRGAAGQAAPAGGPPPGEDRLPRRHADRRRRQHPAGLGLAGRQPVRLGLARPPRCSSPPASLVIAAALLRRGAASPPTRSIPLRLFRDRTTALATAASALVGVVDVRRHRLPQPVLPARPGHEPHRGRPDVDRDGRRAAGLQHRHRPDHHRDRPLEALPRRRHGARRRRPGPARHHRRQHPARRGRRLHGRPRPRPRRHHAEPRPGRAEQHRPGRHGRRQLGRRVLPVDGRLGRRLGRSARCSPTRCPTRSAPAWPPWASTPATRAAPSPTSTRCPRRSGTLYEHAFGEATGHIFLVSVPFAVLALVCVLLIREVPLRTTLDADGRREPRREAASR